MFLYIVLYLSLFAIFVLIFLHIFSLCCKRFFQQNDSKHCHDRTCRNGSQKQQRIINDSDYENTSVRRSASTAKQHGKRSCHCRTCDTRWNDTQRIGNCKRDCPLCDKGKSHNEIRCHCLLFTLCKPFFKKQCRQSNSDRRNHTSKHCSEQDSAGFSHTCQHLIQPLIERSDRRIDHKYHKGSHCRDSQKRIQKHRLCSLQRFWKLFQNFL